MRTGPWISIGMLAGLFISTQGALAGEITARGSDSTIQLVQALAEAHHVDGGGVVRVEGGGSGKGAKDCLDGLVPLAFLSRELKKDEQDAGLTGLPYALDGVAVIVNTANPLTEVTVDELKALFAGEKTTWPGGNPVVLLDRNPASGTRECFVNVVLGKTAMSPKAMVKHDGIIESTVEKIPGAVAFTSFGEVAGKAVKVLSVNGVAPTSETIRSKTYVLARTLTLATKGEPSAEAKAFIDFVMGEKGRAIVSKMGYVLLAQ